MRTANNPDQIDLFSMPIAPRRPIPARAKARRSDPISSHEAAADLNSKGVVSAQARQVFEALKIWPDSTSAELANHMRAERVMPARRLPDLRSAGFVAMSKTRRMCSITGRLCFTWTPLGSKK